MPGTLLYTGMGRVTRGSAVAPTFPRKGVDRKQVNKTQTHKVIWEPCYKAWCWAENSESC